MESRDPQRRVPLVEQRPPEPERQAGDDAAAGRRLALPFDATDRLADTPARDVVEDARVLEPRVMRRGGWIDRREAGVDGVAQQYLDVMQRLEHRRRELRVPDVERDGTLVVAVRLGEVRAKPRGGDPAGCLKGVQRCRSIAAFALDWSAYAPGKALPLRRCIPLGLRRFRSLGDVRRRGAEG